MTKEDLKDIMTQYPNLTASGVDGKEDPKALFNFLDACNASCEWLSLVKRTKWPNRHDHNSYGFKPWLKAGIKRNMANGSMFRMGLL